nr:oligosaccharide flippase family protein [Nitrospirota bacterium]
MSAIRHLSQGIAIKGAANGVALLLGLGLSVILNRVLGKDSYGLLVLVYSVTALATALYHLGVRPALNRFVPKFRREAADRIPVFILTGLIFQLLGAALFAVLMWTSAEVIGLRFFERAELVPLLKVATVFVLCSSLLDFVLQLFQAYEEWRWEGLLSVLYPLIYLAGATFAVTGIHAGIGGVLLANAVAASFTAGIGWLIIRTRWQENIWRYWEPGAVRTSAALMLGFGAPLLMGQFNFYLLTWFDKAILGRYEALEVVTFYFIATTFLGGLMALFKVLFTVFMPYLAGIDGTDQAGVERKFVLMFRWFLQAAVVMAIVSYFAVEPVILTLYGPDYMQAVTAFRWLIPVFLLRAVHNPSGMFVINVFERTGKATSLGVLLAGIYVILNLLLVPIYGLYGAIWAGIASYVIYWVVFLGVFREIGRMLPYRAFLRTMGVVLLMATGGLALHQLGLHNGLILGALCLVFYMTLLLVFREIGPGDIALVKGSFASLRMGRQAS